MPSKSSLMSWITSRKPVMARACAEFMHNSSACDAATACSKPETADDKAATVVARARESVRSVLTISSAVSRSEVCRSLAPRAKPKAAGSGFRKHEVPQDCSGCSSTRKMPSS